MVGTLRKPALWESTAVPELRSQAATVAGAVLDLLKQERSFTQLPQAEMTRAAG